MLSVDLYKIPDHIAPFFSSDREVPRYFFPFGLMGNHAE